MSKPFLSIIIPAYNEERRIVVTLRDVVDYLSRQSYTWEVVLVNDGSTDATERLARDFKQTHPNVHMMNVSHGGKGWAVRHGMLWAIGEYRFLCDADLSMPIEQISRFLPPAAVDFDIAIASREVSEAQRIGEPYKRHFMGRVYNLLVRLLAVPGVSDTQCGFKCFRGEVADDLFSLQRLYGFAFDVEILFMARKRGLGVREVAIDWYYRPESKVRPMTDSVSMGRDILKIRWHNARGMYSCAPAQK